jgi:hypothetical protein
MFTLINCGSVACAAAGDKISVKIRDGDSGDFNVVKTIEGRFKDDKWSNDYFSFDVLNDKIWVLFL